MATSAAATGPGPAYPVARFIEKPALDVARQFVASGDYYWNSGMFVFRARRYLAELEKFAPDILEASKAAFEAAKTDLDFVRIDKASFERCRSDSIDYAVMEKTRAAVVVPLDAGWSDVGSWASLFDALPADEDGNVAQGRRAGARHARLLRVLDEPPGGRGRDG